MSAEDLLEELKLSNYYPQKLSFSEATKLTEKSQNGCPRQYGLEIVRKLLMLDSTAVVSVTTEMNSCLKYTSYTEIEIKGESHSNGNKQPQRNSVRPSWRTANAEQRQRNLHPMDLLVVVMNCCDNLLRQVLVEKMFTNKLSIPILLPNVRNDSYTLLLLALRSLVPEVHDEIRESSSSLTDTLADVRNPIVSFIRLGKLHRSKSKLINDLLNHNSFNTFFHRECPHGSVERSVSNGSIEAAWFQSSTATDEEFNCRFFTVLNLRGDARDYPNQTQFLWRASTLVVFMVDSFESFKGLYENVSTDVDVSKTKLVVSYISPESPDNVDDKYFLFLQDLSDRGVISAVIYDWLEGTTKMGDVDFTNQLRKTISKFMKPEHRLMPTYANFSQSGRKIGFPLDEDELDYELKTSADEITTLVLTLKSDCKQIILPLQGDPWKEIGRLEREQRRKPQNKSQDEHFIAKKETEKRRQRELQCRSLIKTKQIIISFSLEFHTLQDQSLLCLNFWRINLDARSRVIISGLIEEYKMQKRENRAELSTEGEPESKLKKIELKIANSAFGLEHILRELGQMYEAVISEEVHMWQELKKAPLTPEVIRDFPKIVARLLLLGQPLELMDGDASNVPLTWLRAVLHEVAVMTTNAKVFVLSIIGVQSSGKSTLLNALFGLQFPVSAGRCTKGIYCHLVPVDKESLHVEYDYVLVVDTEGLGSSELTGISTFRDNELATFAIGLADATVINMKGENWAEMGNILQIVAYGLIRIRKTKAELELMPKCMFVYQNVPAADAERKNQLGQENQLTALDQAIKTAGHKEGFADIKKFDDVIRYDADSHSWYFPDLWHGKPPKAKISQDYIAKTNELRQYVLKLMNNNPSKMTISNLFLRISDLWNAMLHDDFLLCFRNTKDIISGTVLNDRISHEVDIFKTQNKAEQKKIHDSIGSCETIEEFRTKKDGLFREVSASVGKNFTNMKTVLHAVIVAIEKCSNSRQKYEDSLNVLKCEELRRIEHETTKVINVHMKKLEIGDEQGVRDLKTRQSILEGNIDKMNSDTLNETAMKEFEDAWQHLLADKKKLDGDRMKSIEDKVKATIRISSAKFYPENKIIFWQELFMDSLNEKMPQVIENDIVQKQKTCKPTRFVMDFVYSKSFVHKANSELEEAIKEWKLQFQNQRDIEFNASYLEDILRKVGRLLGISCEKDEHGLETDEMCSVLPPGYRFSRDYITNFIKFICNFAYNQSLENSKCFISITDPLSDIDERYHRSVSCFQQKTAKANIDAVSEQIFDFAVRSFVEDLGELIKREVCREDNKKPTFKTKRSFLKTILIHLGRKTHKLVNVKEKKQNIFKDFMLYLELGESVDSEAFFLNVIVKLLKEMLTNKKASETDFEQMVKNNVGNVVEKAKAALRQADTKSEGRASDYIQNFKDCMSIGNAVVFRIHSLDGFTEEVVKKIDKLYADFLNQANSSFEALVSKNNRAAIRPLLEKIMGCRKKCPFCSAPCSQSLQKHNGEHRANHYPMGVSGTVDTRGWFISRPIHETSNASDAGQRKWKKLALDTCQTVVGTNADFRTKESVQKYSNTCHWFLNLNYHSFQKYREVEEYENWDIPYSQDHKTSLYWKWFMAQFSTKLANHYNASSPKIPEAWEKISWKEAAESLEEPDLNPQFSEQ